MKKAVALGSCSILLYCFVGYGVERSDSFELLSACFLLFGLAFYLLPLLSQKQLLFSGLLFRAVLLFVIPNLSPDFYRFFWDGLLLSEGVNPYLSPPEEIVQSLPDHFSILYDNMSGLSQQNHSNYPPISQLGFWLSTLLLPQHLLTYLMSMRILLILADLGVFYIGTQLLKKLKLNPKRIGWYFLNPLVIIELTGNLHWEGVMLLFFLWGWLFTLNQKKSIAALFFALSVGTKLIPLLLLPVFSRFQNIKSSIKMAGVGLLTLGILFLPFFYTIGFDNYLKTLSLWFKNFEFNGSIYYAIRWAGYQVKGYNVIRQWGEVVPWIILGVALCFAFFKKKKNAKEVFSSMLLLLTFYYGIASIVHPWYIINLIALSVFTSYRFPLVWGALVMLSYTTYAHPNFEENQLLISLEYLIVYGVLLYEIFAKKALFKHFE